MTDSTPVPPDSGNEVEPRMGYLLKMFPRVSETFILNEVLQLERLGMNLHVYSLNEPAEKVRHKLFDTVKSPITYLPFPLTRNAHRYLAAHAKLLVRHPRGYLRTLVEVIRSRDGDLWERFVQGGYLAGLLRRDDVRHVHAGFVHFPGSVAWVVHRITGITFSLATHARDMYLSPPALLKKKLNASSLVLTCTQYNVPNLEAIAGEEGIPRLRRIYHGTKLDRFEFTECGGDDPPLVLSVARLVEKKGLHHLMHACVLLKERGVRFRVRIIGDGEWKEKLRTLLDELGIGDVMSLEGALPQEEVIRWYRRATIFTLPSQITEEGDRDGIPNSIVESMACGLPVLSTPVSGIPELVRDGETGRLVPPCDPEALAAAIAEMLGSRTLRDRIRRGARAAVERTFDLERNAVAVAAELRACLQPGAGPVDLERGASESVRAEPELVQP
jgi:glycosyltransferase involved in cell wall biosynthesis